MRIFIRCLISIWLLSSTVAIAQTVPGAPQLSLPVDCRIGEACLVQKLHDLQAGPGRRDYRCGTLTTEEHDGIDIRVRTLAEMKRGVAVLAASDGIVLRVRDGMEDVSVKNIGAGAVENRMAGNGLVISHSDGWETQYSHLRKNSLRVKPGDKVTTSTPLGLIGMSGNAEFPHLHFALRYKGKAIDPFLGPAGSANCVDDKDAMLQGLWTRDAAAALRYTASGIIAAGFIDTAPQADAVRNQTSSAVLTRQSPALILWVDSYGVVAGDIETLSLRGPDQQLLLQIEKPIPRSTLSWFSFFGKKRPASTWAPGLYVAKYQLLRHGKAVASIEQRLQLD